MRHSVASLPPRPPVTLVAQAPPTASRQALEAACQRRAAYSASIHYGRPAGLNQESKEAYSPSPEIEVREKAVQEPIPLVANAQRLEAAHHRMTAYQETIHYGVRQAHCAPSNSGKNVYGWNPTQPPNPYQSEIQTCSCAIYSCCGDLPLLAALNSPTGDNLLGLDTP